MQPHENSLRDALSDDGDLELRFQCGQSLPVHSQKLKLASSVLKGLITAVLDDLIAAAAIKRRRTAEGSCSIEELPSLQVNQAVLYAGTLLSVMLAYLVWALMLKCPCTNTHAQSLMRQCPCTNTHAHLPMRQCPWARMTHPG